MTQTQQRIMINVTAVRFDETQASVEFSLLPGNIAISMPVLLPSEGLETDEILQRAWTSLSYYLQEWSQVALAKDSEPDRYLQRRYNNDIKPIPSQPAPAVADLATKDELRTYYATKTDLAELKADLANPKSDLKSDITSAFRWTIVAMLGGIPPQLLPSA